VFESLIVLNVDSGKELSNIQTLERSNLLNKLQNVQVSDTTGDAMKTKARLIKNSVKIQNNYKL